MHTAPSPARPSTQTLGLPRRLCAWGLALAAAAAVAGAPAIAAPPLKTDCIADQADRHPAAPLAWQDVAPRDAQRQRHVRTALKQGRLRHAEDYRCAALILVHAGDEASLRLSFALAVQGQALFPSEPALRRLAADAWDRLMMARQQPQWFATQFVAAADAPERFEPYPLASGLMSEAERVRQGGLSDADVARELASLNAEAARARAGRMPPTAPDTPAPAPPAPVRAEPAVLRAALDTDLGMANVLAQLQAHGLQITPQADGSATARLIFLPRGTAPLRAYLLGEVSSLPRPDGSATPTAASVADLRLDAATGPVRQWHVSIDDEVQAAPVLVVRPSRRYRLAVEPDIGQAGWVVTGVQREP